MLTIMAQRPSRAQGLHSRPPGATYTAVKIPEATGAGFLTIKLYVEVEINEPYIAMHAECTPISLLIVAVMVETQINILHLEVQGHIHLGE